MKGFAMLEIGKVGWVEKPKPVCGPIDAVCRPLAAAVCTSDVHTVWEGAVGERHDMILGHECCAEVVSVGELVRDFKPGDRVLVPAITPDWSSLEAQAGFAMHSGGMLAGWKFSNIKNGVFSEFFHVNDADGNLAHLPERMDITEACMLSDMVPTGFHGAELADVQFGDTVLVVGIGPVGLMAVAGAALRGAARILAVGTRPVCVEAARKYGATDFISYKNGPIDEQVLELTGGVAPDCCITTGGTNDTFARCLKMVKPNGIVSNLQAQTFDTEIPGMYTLYWQSHKQVNGGLCPGGRKRMQRLLSIMEAGRLDPTKLITHRFHGMEHIMDAYNMMDVKPDDMVKPVIYND